ncbi:hypothetical protein EDM41_15050, partial [Staphylococcus aureus]
MGAHQITIVDMDIVETSNLHRQALYTEDDALNMVPKVHAIKEHIARINHHVDVQTYYQEITSNNIEDILDEVKPDIVAELLARMGAHQITIVDMDIVETSNLHRQALYT